MTITSPDKGTKMIAISCTGITKVNKTYYLFVTFHTNYGWAKPALSAEPMCLTPTLLIGTLQETQAEPASLIYKAQFSLCVCLNTSETARRTNIKLCTTDHHPKMSVIKGFATSG